MSEKEGGPSGNPEDWQQELNQDYSEHKLIFERAESNVRLWESQLREEKPGLEAEKDFKLVRGFVEDEFKMCWVTPERQQELDLYLRTLSLERADLADLPTNFQLKNDPQTNAPDLYASLYYRTSQEIPGAGNLLFHRLGEGKILQHEYLFPALKLTEMVAERIETFEPGSAYEQALLYFINYLKSQSSDSDFGFPAWQELESRIRSILEKHGQT